MKESEIEVGAVYYCVGGWYRRVKVIEPSRFYSWVEVGYELGRDAKCSQSTSYGPLAWFANKAIERVKP